MRRIASLLAIALLAGCVGAAPSPQPPAGEDSPMHDHAPQTVTLGVGERAILMDGSQLTYLRLVNDSRCPPDVQCVWAGDATIVMRWTPAAGAMVAQDFVLHTTLDPKSFNTGSRTITLQALERGDAPKATLQVESKR